MAQAATPTFSLTGTTLTITSATSGGNIYYVTDGTIPTVSSSHIANGGTVTGVGKGEVVRAFAVVSGYTNSAIASVATVSLFSTLDEPDISTELGSGTNDPTRAVSNKTQIVGTNLGTEFIG
jgi:hypothetical protein